jgi:hypothetical protein
VNNKQLHESGLNIIQNSDGSFSFEWDPKDKRWAWLNGLTDDQIKSIIEESVQTKKVLENVSDELGFTESMGSYE